MRTNGGAIWASIIALFLGFAAVTQVHSQDVFSRSLNLETPSSLTTLIANLSETNNELRNEIFDVMSPMRRIPSRAGRARSPRRSGRSHSFASSALRARSPARASRSESRVASTSVRYRTS
jgi:hypothetical protein